MKLWTKKQFLCSQIYNINKFLMRMRKQLKLKLKKKKKKKQKQKQKTF